MKRVKTGHDPVKQFHEDRIFKKELEPNIIAAKDAEESKLMAAREEGSQEDHVTGTVSLDTLTIYLEGVYIAHICYVTTSHMTEILELKQDKLELKQEKLFVNSPRNGAVYPTENLIEK
jgi:hypothetical protein